MSTDVHTLSGAYALHSLDEPERRDFETHLAGCASCRSEVSEFEEVTARLAELETVEVPTHLREQVLREAARTKQLRPEVPAESAADAASPLRRRRWAVWVATAAAATVAAVGVGVAVDRLDDPALPPAAATVFSAPDAEVREVPVGEGVFEVAISPSRNEMAVDARALPDLPEDRVYQLWTVVDGRPQSVGVVSTGAAMAMPEEGATVTLTVEPAGGSPVPTGDPLVSLDPSQI